MALFTQTGNFKPKKIEMSTDGILHKKLKAPLSSIRSGCFICIDGSAGSGKSSLLVNLMTKEKSKEKGEKGMKLGLSRCFDNIFIVSPSMKSFDNDIFSTIDNSFKFDNLLDFLNAFGEFYDEEEGEIAIIFDDVGSQIRTKECITKFNKLIHNRRHRHATIFMLVQNLTMVVPAIRESINILISFKPKTVEEKELIFSYTGLPKKYMNKFYKFFFQEKHDSILIDMTLNNSADYEFFRNIFNRVIISDGIKD